MTVHELKENLDKFDDNLIDEDAEIYLQAIEKAVDALQD